MDLMDFYVYVLIDCMVCYLANDVDWVLSIFQVSKLTLAIKVCMVNYVAESVWLYGFRSQISGLALIKSKLMQY